MSNDDFKPVSPSVILKRLDSYRGVIGEIQHGLEGKPFGWGAAEYESYVHKAAAMGCTLVTQTAIKKRGLQLKKGAAPVGSAYFRAPIGRHATLYVLECQCVKKETADPKEAKS